MNIKGALLGGVVFCCIGIFHPIVVAAEYHFGKRIWRFFFAAGMLSVVLSLFIHDTSRSIIAGTMGFCLVWAAHEVCEQHKRVLSGRARRNPKRNYENLLPLIAPLHSAELQTAGLIVGTAALIMIKLAHDSVIIAEYHFGKRCWTAYLFIGLTAIVGSFFISNLIMSVILSLFGFICLWGIIEIIEQEKRVKKGWFPKNPKRTSRQQTQRDKIR